MTFAYTIKSRTASPLCTTAKSSRSVRRRRCLTTRCIPTQMLIQSMPRVGDQKHREGISGRPPSLIDPPPGCRFAARCPFVMDICREEMPSLLEVEPDHFVACYLQREPLQARKGVG